MNSKKLILISVGCLLIASVIIGTKVYNNNKYSKYFIELNYEEFINKIDNIDSFPIVFTAEGCSHCAIFIPKVKKIAYDYKLLIYSMDLASLEDEEYQDIKNTYYVTSTPTTVFFEDGEELYSGNRVLGNVSDTEFVERLKVNGYIE